MNGLGDNSLITGSLIVGLILITLVLRGNAFLAGVPIEIRK